MSFTPRFDLPPESKETGRIGDPTESRIGAPQEIGGWKDSIELPEGTEGWVDSIELPSDAVWQDAINLNTIAVEKRASEVTGKSENESAGDVEDVDLSELLKAYFNDLKARSEFPETLTGNEFEVSDLRKLSPEENAEMREEFDDLKPELKRQWEIENGRPWPKYETDVYSASGKLIRKAGSDYDAHHIQPLSLGGKNEASNITPLHAEVHYDKQGVHAPNSPYSQLDKALGGI